MSKVSKVIDKTLNGAEKIITKAPSYIEKAQSLVSALTALLVIAQGIRGAIKKPAAVEADAIEATADTENLKAETASSAYSSMISQPTEGISGFSTGSPGGVTIHNNGGHVSVMPTSI